MKLLKNGEHCEECKKDKNIFCPRNVDGQCLECGIKLCAGHLMIHFKKIHCMALDFNHCSKEVSNSPNNKLLGILGGIL